MNSKKDVQKSHKRLLKRYSNISEISVSDVESIKLPADKFTPFSKIPAIGQTFKNFKNTNKFMVNYHSDTDSVKSAAAFNSKIPIFQNDTSSSKNLKDSHLLRRNTYVVLEPIVCVHTTEKSKNRHKGSRNSNLQQQNLLDNTKLFGKAFTSFDSDTDMSAGDEMSPKNKVDVNVKNENLSTLNYLLSNLKLSRSTETDLLRPKNNPWLL